MSKKDFDAGKARDLGKAPRKDSSPQGWAEWAKEKFDNLGEGATAAMAAGLLFAVLKVVPLTSRPARVAIFNAALSVLTPKMKGLEAAIFVGAANMLKASFMGGEEDKISSFFEKEEGEVESGVKAKFKAFAPLDEKRRRAVAVLMEVLRLCEHDDMANTVANVRATRRAIYAAISMDETVLSHLPVLREQDELGYYDLTAPLREMKRKGKRGEWWTPAKMRDWEGINELLLREMRLFSPFLLAVASLTEGSTPAITNTEWILDLLGDRVDSLSHYPQRRKAEARALAAAKVVKEKGEDLLTLWLGAVVTAPVMAFAGIVGALFMLIGMGWGMAMLLTVAAGVVAAGAVASQLGENAAKGGALTIAPVVIALALFTGYMPVEVRPTALAVITSLTAVVWSVGVMPAGDALLRALTKKGLTVLQMAWETLTVVKTIRDLFGGGAGALKNPFVVEDGETKVDIGPFINLSTLAVMVVAGAGMVVSTINWGHMLIIGKASEALIAAVAGGVVTGLVLFADTYRRHRPVRERLTVADGKSEGITVADSDRLFAGRVTGGLVLASIAEGVIALVMWFALPTQVATAVTSFVHAYAWTVFFLSVVAAMISFGWLRALSAEKNKSPKAWAVAGVSLAGSLVLAVTCWSFAPPMAEWLAITAVGVWSGLTW